jgi:predicted secreted protein
MAYSISTALAIYFVLWWIVLFVTLPFGVRSQHEGGEGAGQVIPGTDPGAPVMARMGWKLLWTTLISGVVFGIGMWAYYQGYLNIERLSKLMGLPF